MMKPAFLLCLLLLTTSCKSAGDELVLTDHGRSNYQLLLPAQPTRAEQKAAGILQDYVQRITGIKLPIAAEGPAVAGYGIYIGATEAGAPEKIPAEGFVIRTDAKNVYIRGGSGQGIVYGVYHLLDAYFGCKKFDNGAAYTPKEQRLHLRANMRDAQHPAFIYRQSYYPASQDPEYLSWHGLQQLDDLWGLWGHSFFKMLPPEVYFKAHPEYYSQVNGKRQPMQLCLSSQAVYDAVVAYLDKAVQHNPDALYWSIAPEDNNNYCTCDLCKKADAEEGSPAGSLIRFVNKLAARFPQQRFTTLAYGYTAQAPHTPPADNVYIFVSSIDAYRGMPLAQEPSAAAFRKHLQDWKALGSHLFVWDYTTQFTNYLAPFPDYENLQPNLQYFASQGVQGVFSQGSGDTYGDMAAWNSYLQAALLWDPQADVTALKKEFFEGYYGKAGTLVADYVNALSNAVKAGQVKLDIYGSPVNNVHNYLSPANMARYTALLDKAEQAAGNKAPYAEHVWKTRLALDYAMLQQSLFYGIQEGGYRVEDNNDHPVKPEWQGRVSSFYDRCLRFGVKEMAEGGLTPEQYNNEWKERITAVWMPNKALNAPVKVATPFAQEYMTRGAASLTDGALGTTDYSFNWLYFQRQHLDATIEQSLTFSSVQTQYLEDVRHFIVRPVDATLQVSDDGVHFTTIATQKLSPMLEDTDDGKAQIKVLQFKLPKPVSTHYLRLQASCPDALPEWRGASHAPAICFDEIIVD